MSPHLVVALADQYPGSAHVRDVGLATASDEAVWQHALVHGFTIASKDSDFHQRSFLHGSPPKVVWVRVGNRSTAAIEQLLRSSRLALERFEADPQATFLAIS